MKTTRTFVNFKDGKMMLKDSYGKTNSIKEFTGHFKDIESKASPYGTTQWSFKFVNKDGEYVFVGDVFNRSIITLINMLSTLKSYSKPITIKTELKQTRKGKDYTHIHVFYNETELQWNKHLPEIPKVQKDKNGNAVSDANFQQMFLYLYVDIKQILTATNENVIQKRKLF